MPTIQIPDYVLLNAVKHLSKAIESAKPEWNDIAGRNAVRLGKKDIRKLTKIIEESKK